MALRIVKPTAPVSPERLLQTAESALDAGNYERAIELLSAPALASSKEWDEASLKMLGYALFKLGRTEEASEAAASIIERAPFEPIGYNLLGLILHGLQEYAAAERFFRRVLELDSTHPEARRSIVDCIRGKNRSGSTIPQELSPFMALLDQPPRGSAEELLKFGIQAYEHGLRKAATDCFFRALEQEPENPFLFRYLAMVLMDEGELDKAMVAIAQAIRLAPSDPDGFNMMGVLLTRLRQLGAAEKFFKRTLLLNPRHASAQASLETVEGKGEINEPSLAPILDLLELWIPRISLCLIAKNEEKFLQGCLESAREAVDEIILVDTGSTDATVSIAEEFGAKVFSFPWQNDFAAARNEALSHASGDWILVLDADEKLTPGSFEILREAAWNRSIIGYTMIIDNRLGESEDSSHLQTSTIFRFFQNRPDMRYVGAVHEQMFPAAKASGLPQAESSARILHLGYIESTFNERDKLKRNLDILLKQAEEDAENPYVYFNLGQSYKMAGELLPAEENYRKALKKLQEQKHSIEIPYYLALYLNLALLYYEHKRYEQALAVCAESIPLYPDYPDLRFAQGLSLMDLGRYEEALDSFRSALAFKGRVYASGSDPGTSSYKNYNAMAVVYTRMGNWGEARRFFEMAIQEWPTPNANLYVDFGLMAIDEGAYQDALGSFAKALELQPDHAKALIGASIAYTGLDLPQDALNVIRKAFDSHPDLPGIGFHLGNALLNSGRYREALETFAAETLKDPANWNLQQNAGLAELLLGDLSSCRKRWENFPETQNTSAAVESALLFLDLLGGKEKLEIKPEFSDQWLYYVRHLIKARRAEAIEKLVFSVERLVQLPEVALGLGEGLLQADLPDQAMGVLLVLQNAQSKDPRVFYYLGEACLKKNLREDARTMFERTLELKPSFYEARRKLLTL